MKKWKSGSLWAFSKCTIIVNYMYGSDNLLQPNIVHVPIFLENSLICRIYFKFDGVNLCSCTWTCTVHTCMYINCVLLDKVSSPPASLHWSSAVPLVRFKAQIRWFKKRPNISRSVASSFACSNSATPKATSTWGVCVCASCYGRDPCKVRLHEQWNEVLLGGNDSPVRFDLTAKWITGRYICRCRCT